MKKNALTISKRSNQKNEEAKTIRRLELMVEKQTRELKETRDELLHQNRMASLGKLSASAVHEINNSIAGILTLTMLIKRIVTEESLHLKESEQFSRYLDLMETEIRRVSRIASNLLAFSRKREVESKPLSLNRLIEKTLLLNANLFKINRIKIEKKLSSNLPEIMGSEDQLQQVLMNIIYNAAEAMAPTGSGLLTLETRHSLKDAKIQVRINDSGVGIAHENLPRLFDPFFTTKKQGKGIGIGLSVAYGIVEEHSGSIKAESTVGKGTTFVIEFPLQPQSVALEQHGG